MKKYFGIMLATVFAVLPLSVKAAAPVFEIANCTQEGDIITCKGGVSIDANEPVPSITIKFTEIGKAKIMNVLPAEGVELTSKNEAEHTYTFSFSRTDEFDLLTISYNTAGDPNEECKITYSYNGNNKTIPDIPNNTDTPTDNKKTGSTLPYIALGGLALVAAGAYVATRNKSKMYKI